MFPPREHGLGRIARKPGAAFWRAVGPSPGNPPASPHGPALVRRSRSAVRPARPSGRRAGGQTCLCLERRPPPLGVPRPCPALGISCLPFPGWAGLDAFGLQGGYGGHFLEFQDQAGHWSGQTPGRVGSTPGLVLPPGEPRHPAPAIGGPAAWRCSASRPSFFGPGRLVPALCRQSAAPGVQGPGGGTRRPASGPQPVTLAGPRLRAGEVGGRFPAPGQGPVAGRPGEGRLASRFLKFQPPGAAAVKDENGSPPGRARVTL